ncbi:hypothetical protein BAE44_0015729 [Dichanthelium oligosanthes]|uniref:Subtilisin inhibitor 1 n=1 Tax=Dichanthelium oligosanthes TaxID=888268 RepID=A0A1E5VDM7_9POAL|nr:hypothetical protein BAE44_0015729 [Dichanthelium oligosanthes]
MVMIDDDLKTSWPEVVGMDLFWAAAKIHSDRPDVLVEVHKVGDNSDPGYDPKRVRMFVDKDGIVAQTPVIG